MQWEKQQNNFAFVIFLPQNVQDGIDGRVFLLLGDSGCIYGAPTFD